MTMVLDKLYDLEPYGLKHEEKEQMMFEGLLELTEHHRKHCVEYRKILEVQGAEADKWNSSSDIPFIPVRLFKEFELLSTDRSEIVKTMTSSGSSASSFS